MKITYISTVNDVSGMGTRVLSALTRQAGHRSRLVFVPRGEEVPAYADAALREIVALCRGSDAVAMTLFTMDHPQAVRVTERIRRELSVPVIWGGIHATVLPRECAAHADFVCVGEGETVIRQFLEGRAPETIRGLWHRRNGTVVDNGLGPLAEDLDSLPFQDFSFEDHYVVEPGSGAVSELTPVTYERFAGREYQDIGGVFRTFYRTLASRGCPYRCTFCTNDYLQELYAKRYYRVRSVDNAIAELKAVVRERPFIRLICLTDDLFFMRSEREIEEFGERYRKEVGLPLQAVTHPALLTEAKLAAMVRAGLTRLSMGIQSGSRSALTRYNRPVDPAKILQAAKLIHRYRDFMVPPKYDVLVDDPFQTPEEQRDSLLYLSRIPAAFSLHSMVMLPATRLAEEARAAGLEAGRGPTDKDFHFRPAGYYDLLMQSLNIPLIPRWLIRALAAPRLHRLSQQAPALLRLARSAVSATRRLSAWWAGITWGFRMRLRRRRYEQRMRAWATAGG